MKLGIIFIYLTAIAFKIAETKATYNGLETRRAIFDSPKECPMGYQEFRNLCFKTLKLNIDIFGREISDGSEKCQKGYRKYQDGPCIFESRGYESLERTIFNIPNECPAGYQKFRGVCVENFKYWDFHLND